MSMKNKNLNEIDGWLGFLIFVLIIFSPIVNLGLILLDITSYEIAIASITLAILLPIISLSILAGIFLWAKKPYAVKFTKIYLIITLIFEIFLMFLLNESAILIVSPIIWLLYLNKSKRVKAVYGSLKEKDKGLQVWPILAIIYAVLAPIFGIIFAQIGWQNTIKNPKLKGRYLSIIALIIGTLILIVTIIAFLVGIGSTDTPICEYPNEIVGEKDCCIPNYDYGVILCSEEAEKLDAQLMYAIDNEIVTTKNTEAFLDKFSILLPEGYLALRNAKAGLYDYPLILMSSDKEGNVIMIIVMYSESTDYYESLKDIYPEIESGLLAGSVYSTFSEPVFSENIEKGTETAILKSVNKQEGLEIFISNAFIKKDNKLIAIKYGTSSKELYDYYHYEFDDMVNSVTFK